MSVFKRILKIFLIIFFVFSVLLNIILFGSSYGSLAFKYDETKFTAMHTTTLYKNYDLSPILSKKKYGIQYTITNLDGYNEIFANYYVDKESNLNFYIKLSKTETVGTESKAIVEEIYYKDGYLYLNNYTNNGLKIKGAMAADQALNEYNMFNSLLTVLTLDAEIIKHDDEKTRIGFSFSPFYTLGITYKYEDDAKNNYKYDYDLNGNLRKFEAKTKINDKDVTTTFKVTYKDKAISFPNFDEYVSQ